MEYSLPHLKRNRILLSKVQYIFKGGDIKNHLDLFGSAKKILIYAGELNSHFYGNLEFLSNLEISLGSGCEIKTIFGPAVYVGDTSFLELACQSEQIKLYKRPHRDPAHFKIIKDINENVFALVDEPHEINSSVIGQVKSALLVKGYEVPISRLMQKFHQELAISKKIDRSNIIAEFSDRGERDNELYGFITQKDDEVTLASDEHIDALSKTFI